MNDFIDQFITGGFRPAKDLKRVFGDYERSYGHVLGDKKHSEILDIGCGAGHFLKFLKHKGFMNCIGIDASREMVDYCHQDGEVEVEYVNDVVNYLKDRRKCFDFIFLNDVIEHFTRESISDNLKAVFDSLKCDGKIVIKTGNTATLAGFFLRYKDFTHCLGFTEYSLRQVLLVAGFEDIDIQGNTIEFQWRPKRIARFLGANLITFFYRVYYSFHYGEGGPTIFSKLLIATAKKPSC